MRKYTTIKLPNSVSQVRRLPRLGKIRLGVVAVSKGGKEYPKEVDYFVCPPEVQQIYGGKPKAIEVMFPVEQEEMIFPQFLGAYGSNHKLLCHGDGETAERYDKEAKGWITRPCPCEWLDEGKCDRRSNLMVVLPRINLGGVYQIDSGSFNTIVNLNSYFEYLRFLVGRISWIPVKLVREAQQTLDPDGKNQTHYPIKVLFDGTVDAVNALRQQSDRIIAQVKTYALPEPILEGPLPDTPKELVEEKEEKQQKQEDAKPQRNIAQPTQYETDKKQDVLDEVRSLMSMEDVLLFEKEINIKIKGFKTHDVVEISRELNKRKVEVQKLATAEAPIYLDKRAQK